MAVSIERKNSIDEVWAQMDAQGIPVKQVEIKERQFTEEEKQRLRERTRATGIGVITLGCFPFQIQIGVIDFEELNQRKLVNILACIPGLNVVIGIGRIAFGVFGSPPVDYTSLKDICAFRILNITVGLFELTWVGAIIIHGIASLLFFDSRCKRSILSLALGAIPMPLNSLAVFVLISAHTL